MEAIIFDVDGTMADTERDGHLQACNEAFETMGFPINWSWDEFKAMLHIQGNAIRMRMALEKLTPSLSSAEIEAAMSELVPLKQRLYIEKYVPRLPLLPGVRSLIEEAVARGVRLAIVSSSDDPQIHALLRHQLPELADKFNPVLGKLVAKKTAPDSPLYRQCISELGTDPSRTLVIEDSEVGFKAAQRAGLPCAVIYNDYTYGQDFAGAVLVARSLEFFNLDRLTALCL
jgi:HAD superfamily hydrolase (TIGR01509 family)